MDELPVGDRDSEDLLKDGRDCTRWGGGLGRTVWFMWDWSGVSRMSKPIELGDELVARLESHAEEDESIAELLEELVSIYEQEGRFLQEGP